MADMIADGSKTLYFMAQPLTTLFRDEDARARVPTDEEDPDRTLPIRIPGESSDAKHEVKHWAWNAPWIKKSGG